MPTYVYECSSCNDRFEVEQRITENALEICPCGSIGTVKRIIQPVGVMFKGSGFHINDYAPKGETPPASEAKTESAPSTESSPAPAAAPAPSSTDSKKDS